MIRNPPGPLIQRRSPPPLVSDVPDLLKFVPFIDWDRCKSARREFVSAFMSSSRAPADLGSGLNAPGGDGGGEEDAGHGVGGEFVVAGGDASPVLEPEPSDEVSGAINVADIRVSATHFPRPTRRSPGPIQKSGFSVRRPSSGIYRGVGAGSVGTLARYDLRRAAGSLTPTGRMASYSPR